MSIEKQIWTTKDLAEGRVAIKYQGNNLERLKTVLKEAFPDSYVSEENGVAMYYSKRDTANDYTRSNTLFRTEGVSHISEQEIFLESELDQSQYLGNIPNSDLHFSSSEKPTTTKLPCVSVFQNGICVVKDMHFSNYRLKKNKSLEVIGTFYGNESDNVFVPIDCITMETHEARVSKPFDKNALRDD